MLTSAGHLLWIYRQLFGMSHIALARLAQIYRNISDPLGRLALYCIALLYIALQRKRERSKVAAKIYKWTNFQHHHSLSLSAALIQLIPQNNIEQPILDQPLPRYHGWKLCWSKEGSWQRQELLFNFKILYKWTGKWYAVFILGCVLDWNIFLGTMVKILNLSS